MKRKIISIVFCGLFVSVLGITVFGKLLDKNESLSGVTEESEEVDLTWENVLDGSYQSSYEESYASSFKGNMKLLKIKNQILYSLFNISPNSNITVGKNKTLFETGYIYHELQIYAPSSESYFETLGTNLQQLEQLLGQYNKELYVFVTPDKAHYYYDDIPYRFKKAAKDLHYEYTNHEKLISTLEDFDVPYFDSYNYIDNNENTLKAPIFYKSGTHWSHSYGVTCANELVKYMNANGQFDISTLSIEEVESKEPISPDTDIYDSLNLIFPAKETWYDVKTSIDHVGSDSPNIFYRGGSFMGQSVSYLNRAGIFKEDVHFENSYYFTNGYSASYFLDSYTDYDSADLDHLMGKSDILVLEVNDGAISQMSFGFIDYLLAHPEVLDREY